MSFFKKSFKCKLFNQKNMPEFVIKNKLNYSMIDTIDYKNANINYVIDKIFNLICNLNNQNI